jgi:DNA/RNA-binding protein KIN17
MIHANALHSIRFTTNRVKANNVYQEYIQDKHHLHMNSTRWVSLTEFIKHLGRSGIVRVDETEKGLFISWIDNSPKALAKAEANKKKERAVTSDEQRERMLIVEQIERAKAEGVEESRSSGSPEPVGLQREEGAAPLRLAFGTKKSPDSAEKEQITPARPDSPRSTEAGTDLSPMATGSSSSAASISQPATKINVFKKTSVPTRTAPLKTNVFKALKAKSSSSSSPSVSGSVATGDKRSRDEMPAAQRLILEEQERKRRRVDAV